MIISPVPCYQSAGPTEFGLSPSKYEGRFRKRRRPSLLVLSRSAREDPQGPHDDDEGDRAGAPKAFSRRLTASCENGIIIVIIMNLRHCRFSAKREND